MDTVSILRAIAGTACFLSFSASATPISINYAGFENSNRTGDIYGQRDLRVAAGQFKFDVIDDGGVFWDVELNAFCIDVSTNLVTDSTVQYDLIAAGSSSYLNNSQRSLLGQLFDQHAGSLGGATEDAAFQLSLWEIIYDYDDTLNLLSGAVPGTFSASYFSGARATAAGWLSGLDATLNYVSTSYELWVLSPIAPQRNQTLLTWKPVSVPEPATLTLLGAGLLLVGATARRRSSR